MFIDAIEREKKDFSFFCLQSEDSGIQEVKAIDQSEDEVCYW